MTLGVCITIIVRIFSCSGISLCLNTKSLFLVLYKHIFQDLFLIKFQLSYSKNNLCFLPHHSSHETFGEVFFVVKPFDQILFFIRSNRTRFYVVKVLSCYIVVCSLILNININLRQDVSKLINNDIPALFTTRLKK